MDHEIGSVSIAAEKSVKLTYMPWSYYVKGKFPKKLFYKRTVFSNGNSKC